MQIATSPYTVFARQLWMIISFTPQVAPSVIRTTFRIS